MGFRNRTSRFRLLRRPRLQYGLRSLLIATLLVCLALGLYVERVRRQHRAVAALAASGAKIYYNDGNDQSYFDAADFAAGESVENPGTLTEWLEFLTPRRLRTALGIDFFRRVDRIDCPGDADSSLELRYLCDLTGLRGIELRHALDEDLEIIGTLGELTYLHLSASIISDAGLAHLAELHKLERLDVRYRGDALTSLSHQQITDAGLAHLAGLRRLKYLDLSGSSIRGEGLFHLTGMTDLERLDLGATQLTDAALPHLSRLPRLQWLDIHNTVVTPGLAERMLPKTEVQRYNTSGSQALTRGQTLAHAGCWKDALDALNQENASWLQVGGPQPRNRADRDPSQDASEDEVNRWTLLDIGRCHAGLGQGREATNVFCRLLDIVHASPPPMGLLTEGCVWRHLYEWPQVFELVGRARPNDLWRWITSAERAVVDGRWSDAAADYARAAVFPEAERTGTSSGLLLFECGVSRLLMEDLRGHERHCVRTEEVYRRLAQEALARYPELKEQGFAKFWPPAMHLRLVAPQGAVSTSQLADWRRHEPVTQEEMWLLPLLYCRAGEFRKVLEQEPPQYRFELGRYLFCRAMAHQHLDQVAQAREDYALGSHWLERRMKEDRAGGVQRWATNILEAECLRREAKRLIFK